MSTGRRYRGDLVDVDRGIISREIFVDAGVYEEEQERVFCRTWLFVGHDSQIRRPGDFFTSRMGEESVILTRDKDDGIRVFLNSCRHRGMKVCRYDEGNTSVFSCPYHGWSYGLDGRLRGVPHYRDSYYEELDKDQWGLLSARVATYRGTIWATWNQQAPAFEEYLGGARFTLDAVLDATDGSGSKMEVLPGIQKWKIPSNWKFVSENFIGDFYHRPSHHSVELVGIGPDGDGVTRSGNRQMLVDSLTSFPALGHGWRGSIPDDEAGAGIYPFPTFPDPEVDQYYRDAFESWKRNQGERVPPWLFGNGGTLFPNFSFHARFPRTFAIAHPNGPLETEMWRWFLVDADAPLSVKQMLRRYYLRYSGPAGMTEQDDMENWNYASAASKGAMARRLPYNYQQGLGHWRNDERQAGARVTDGTISDANALALYERWAQLMDEASA